MVLFVDLIRMLLFVEEVRAHEIICGKESGFSERQSDLKYLGNPLSARVVLI